MNLNPLHPETHGRGLWRALLLPCLLLALVGPTASAQMVTVTPSNAFVMPGAERAFTALRSDGQAAHWVWSIEGPAFGATINHVTGLFHAPQDFPARAKVGIRATDPAAPGLTGVVPVHLTHTLIILHAPRGVLQDDEEVMVVAERADPEAPVWAWKIQSPAGGRIERRGEAFYFHPPRVAEATVFTLRALDTAHPADSATASIRVVPAMVRLRRADPQGAPVRSGQFCDLLAMRMDDQPGPFIWSVLDGNGGTVQDLGQGQARYTAPRVPARTTFHVRAASGRYAGNLAIQVRPSINLTPLVSSHVLSGNSCTLTAAYPAQAGVAQAVAWDWTILDGPPLLLTPVPGHPTGDRITFRAPQIGQPKRFTIQVTDSQRPYDPAIIKVDVLPRLPGLNPGAEHVFQQLMPEIMGADWLAPVPSMTLLAGRLEPPRPGQAVTFHGINCITYVEPSPRMAPLGRHWLVGDRYGLAAVSAQGRVGWLRGIHDEVTAIAIRPRGNAPDNPHRVAYACRDPHAPGQSRVDLLATGSWLPVPLAGTLGSLPEAARLEEGRGPQVGFGEIKSLAWTDDGSLLVVDQLPNRTRIRRIAPDGQVTMMPGNTMARPVAMAWYPADSSFYTSFGHAIYQWDLKGKKTVAILGLSSVRPGFMDAPVQDLTFPPSMWPLIPCLNHPEGVAILGPYLFIADTQNNALRVFNRQTRKLLTLTGSPEQKQTRLGPLGYAAADASAHACAALSLPRVLAVNAEGECLVAQGDALVHLDLSAFAQAPAAGTEEPQDSAMKEAAKPAAAGSAAAAAGVPMEIDGAEAPAAAASAAPAAGAAAAARAPSAASQQNRKRPPDGEHEDSHRPPPPAPERSGLD